jgi:hypothetical protein
MKDAIRAVEKTLEREGEKIKITNVKKRLKYYRAEL